MYVFYFGSLVMVGYLSIFGLGKVIASLCGEEVYGCVFWVFCRRRTGNRIF